LKALIPDDPNVSPCSPELPIPINVALVKQLSPFRYPGGKTWLVPYVRHWIRALGFRPTMLIEPFVGGGIISLTAAMENWAERVTMVEIDPDVAAVWETILSGGAESLAKRIEAFVLTEENVALTLDADPLNSEDRAFQTILRNRVNHGGILAPGSSRLKYGENGKGIRSRWYPTTLASRIRTIAGLAAKIAFRAGDGFSAIEEYSSSPNACFLIDPPYTAGGKNAGRRLYTHWRVDHDLLFNTMANLRSPFLATYDESDEILRLAKSHGFQPALVPMQNTHLVRKWELLISRDLSWLESTTLHYKRVGA